MTIQNTRPVVLCILDGWGSRDESDNNAIKLANTPVYDEMMANCPRSTLQTSGLSVGLPEGQMGNSEVGHMNIGGGRVVLQDLPKIDQAIANDQIKDIDCLKSALKNLKQTGKKAHIMGLLSPGGVHSHQDHMVALAREFEKHDIPVAIHAFTDGRDVPPKSANIFVEKFEHDIARLKDVSIATVCGRYYAMDRDNRWDRVEKAHNAIATAKGNHADSALGAIKAAYEATLTDEFIEPTVIGDYDGLKEGDVIIMANFRADRAREILATFVDPDFDGFKKQANIMLGGAIGMTKYSDALEKFMPCLFPSSPLQDTLGEIVSNRGLKQLRIAETEKFAHVTFFFNGGAEEMYSGEERILIPSPDVPTYNLKPEMSAMEVTDKLIEAITSEEFDLIVVNYANPDMVGHTGVLEAAIKAVETIDTCLGRLQEALDKVGGSMLVTADHGNIELMKDPETGGPHTAHTTNLVPFILVGGKRITKGTIVLKPGALCDVAPTVLALMNLPKPDTMTGNNLINV